MTAGKRLFDFSGALFLAVVLSPLIAAVAMTVLVRDGRPLLYKSERMRTPEHAFLLWKFRTMKAVDHDTGVSGGHKAARITPTGQMLRRHRLDELPQLWNILRGDISLVGPRPPLRRYVERYPDLYAAVLQSRPGITGLASMAFHRHEERLLAACESAQETEDVYCRRCVPRKARLDMIYASKGSICADFRLMLATVLKSVSMHQRR